jgi:hypothetical protein
VALGACAGIGISDDAAPEWGAQKKPIFGIRKKKKGCGLLWVTRPAHHKAAKYIEGSRESTQPQSPPAASCQGLISAGSESLTVRKLVPCSTVGEPRCATSRHRMATAFRAVIADRNSSTGVAAHKCFGLDHLCFRSPAGRATRPDVLLSSSIRSSAREDISSSPRHSLRHRVLALPFSATVHFSLWRFPERRSCRLPGHHSSWQDTQSLLAKRTAGRALVCSGLHDSGLE